MRDQHAFRGWPIDSDIGLDRIGAASDIGRHVGRDVAHAGMEHEAVARPVEALGVVGEARREAVVERQHLMRLGLLPPFGDQCLQPFGFLGREIVGLVEILIEMEELPDILVERRARRMERHGLPAVLLVVTWSSAYEPMAIFDWVM